MYCFISRNLHLPRSITSSGLICARKVCLVEKVVESLKKNPCIATNGNILGTNVKGNTKKYTLHFYLKNCEYNANYHGSLYF